jgi:hypothetical protein
MKFAPVMTGVARLSTRFYLRNLVVGVAGLVISATSASAQSLWLGTTSSWNDPANWSTNSIPDQNSQLQFASAAAIPITNNNITTPTPLIVNSISVLSTAPGPILITGNPFVAQNGIDVAAGQELIISSGIGTAGSPAGNLTFTGTGTTELLGTASYVGSTQIQGGTVFVNATLNGSVSVNNSAATLGGNSTITGSVSVNNGSISAGTGAGNSTLTVGGNLTENGNIDVQLFGTGYTNAGTSDIGKIAVGGTAQLNNSVVRLNLSQLSVSDVNQLRSDTLANGPFRDYTILSTVGGISGALPSLNIVDAGNFNPNEWSLLPFTGNDFQLRFSPVPEPASILGAIAFGAGLLGFARRRKQTNNAVLTA